LERRVFATTGPYCPYIHEAGIDRRSRPWTLPQRRLTYYLLVCSSQGEEQITVDGMPYTIPQGASYLIAPGVLTDLGSRQGSRPAWIHFDAVWNSQRAAAPYAGRYDSDLSWRMQFLQPSPREIWGVDLPVRIPLPLEGLFAESIQHIIVLIKRGDRLSILEATHSLAGLLLRWVAVEWKRQPAGNEEDLESRLARAESLARQSISSGFSVSDFADAANFSRSQFTALYQRIRGVTPGAFLRRERIRQAVELLARSDLPLKKVGAMVGYPDPSVFGRVFRAAHGVSPRIWRRRQIGG
jgi:AraC-like DNA-binding protein